MKHKILFTSKKIKELKTEILKNKYPKNTILNFLNLYSVYLFRHHKNFKEKILKKNNIIFSDGSPISAFLSIKHFCKFSRIPGPVFTDAFLRDVKLNKNKKHLFVGLDDSRFNALMQKYPLLKNNANNFDLPVIKEEKYNDLELVSEIKRLSPNYIWICIGNPKQEILANDLSEKVSVDLFFNIGAAVDYLSGNRKPAPRFFRKYGIEWLYRFFFPGQTLSSHTPRKKFFKSLITLPVIPLSVGVKK